MPQIGYRQWALIPLDTDPATGQVQAFKPAMMTAVALDQNTSLVFQLTRPPARLLIQVEVTVLSGEGRSLPLLEVFTGSTGEGFHPLESTPWEKAQDGLYLLFSTQVRGPERFLKLLYTQHPALVVNRVQFFSV